MFELQVPTLNFKEGAVLSIEEASKQTARKILFVLESAIYGSIFVGIASGLLLVCRSRNIASYCFGFDFLSSLVAPKNFGVALPSSFVCLALK